MTRYTRSHVDPCPDAGRAFDQAFGLIVEGACPADGRALERRPGYGFGFCCVCGEGWLAGTGDHRFISRYGDQAHWTEYGTAWTTRARYVDGMWVEEIRLDPVPLPVLIAQAP